MTSRDFCYWLQGFFEIRGVSGGALDAHKTEMIRRHLAMVFVHEIDPSFGDADKQANLNELHNATHKSNDPTKPIMRC